MYQRANGQKDGLNYAYTGTYDTYIDKYIYIYVCMYTCRSVYIYIYKIGNRYENLQQTNTTS